MKSDNKVYLHSLPMMQAFNYYGKKYRTIIPIKEKIVTRCARKREVLDLKTLKTIKLPYFTRVLIFSE
jgi:hypothetical protein